MMENEKVPPYTNRGVQHTQRSALRACVDWLQATLTFVTDLQNIFDLLNLDSSNFTEQPSGIYGYKSHLKMGNISILYNGNVGMGIHIQMTGQGCRQYESLNKKDWRTLLFDILDRGGAIARLDIAIDDIAVEGQKNYFTINQMYRKSIDGCIKSRFEKAKFIKSINLQDGSNDGETLYIGREASDIQIRFYDKMKERKNAKVTVENNVVGWVRTEIQTRRDRAQNLAYHVIENDNLGNVVAGVLKNYLTILVKGKDSNKSRWATAKFWLDYLGDVDKLKLTLIAPDRTIDTAHNWIEKQVTPTLAMLFTAYDGDMNVIHDFIKDGMDRLNDNQLQLAKEYSLQAEEDRKQREQDRKMMWNRYLFKTGAHREVHKIEKVTAPHSDDDTDL